MSDSVLTQHTQDILNEALTTFPKDQARSAIIAGLKAAQHDNQGFLTKRLMDGVAEYLNVPTVQVYEVASFYSMFETKRVGRHSVSICTNVSCMLRGSDELLAHAENTLGVKLGETTPDGRVYLKPEKECLAACCGAPMAMIDHKYHEHLTPEALDKILSELD